MPAGTDDGNFFKVAGIKLKNNMRLYRIIDANQKERGPFDAERIRQRISEGRADAQTKVQVEGGEWTQLGDVPEFAGALKQGCVAPPETAAAPIIAEDSPPPTALARKQCPACRSLNTTATGQFAQAGVQAFKNRICRDCGTAWRPASPRWFSITLIVLGCAMPVLWAVETKNIADTNAAVNNTFNAMGQPSPALTGNGGNGMFILVVSMGGMAVAYGLKALFGKAGKLRILGKVEARKP